MLRDLFPIEFKQQNLDSFGRLLISQATLIGSYDFRISQLTAFFSDALVNSTLTHDAANGCISMNTTGDITSTVIRQSYRHFEYRRGNSNRIFFSVVMGSSAVGNTRRFGYYDENNGVFFQLKDGIFSVGRRFNGVDTFIPQDSFNLDRLDGTGPSGVVLNLEALNNFAIEYAPNAGASFGLFVGGQVIQFHASITSNVEPNLFSLSGQLPTRYENFNTSATTPSTLKIFALAVYSNGAIERENLTFSESNGITAKNFTAAPVIANGVRIKPTVKNISISPMDYDITPTAGTAYGYVRVILRPTITGAVWASLNDISDRLTAGTYVEGTGIVINQGHISFATNQRFFADITQDGDIFLGYNLSGVTDSYIVVVQTTTGSASALCATTFRGII